MINEMEDLYNKAYKKRLISVFNNYKEVSNNFSSFYYKKYDYLFKMNNLKKEILNKQNELFTYQKDFEKKFFVFKIKNYKNYKNNVLKKEENIYFLHKEYEIIKNYYDKFNEWEKENILKMQKLKKMIEQ